MRQADTPKCKVSRGGLERKEANFIGQRRVHEVLPKVAGEAPLAPVAVLKVERGPQGTFKTVGGFASEV